MALMAITQHHAAGPGTPTDQAPIQSFSSHLNGDWPHLTELRDPATLDAELARVRTDFNMVRSHAAIGYVTPDDEHHGRGPDIRRARAAGLRRARAERIRENRRSVVGAAAGAGWTFALNAASFVGLFAVLLNWRSAAGRGCPRS